MLVASEIILCYVFSFLDNLQSVNSVTFITNITSTGLKGKRFQTFHASYYLHASDIVDY